MRLIDAKRADWRDRSHFLAACSQIMRRILVDHARRRKAAKRGGGAGALPLEEVCVVSPEPNTDLVALDEALDTLAKHDPRKAKVVELRFFAGLSVKRKPRPCSQFPRKACCGTGAWRELGSRGSSV